MTCELRILFFPVFRMTFNFLLSSILQKLNRKLVHITLGLVFLLFWPFLQVDEKNQLSLKFIAILIISLLDNLCLLKSQPRNIRSFSCFFSTWHKHNTHASSGYRYMEK
jgi:hypothetical protein